MKSKIGLIAALLACLAAGSVRAEDTLRVGFCAKTITSAAAPFAIANQFGWFGKAAFKVELVPLSGSVDCVKYVGTGELRYSLPSVEPLGVLRPQGIRAKIFYTAYQGNIYGIDVPAASPIKTLQDLKGKKIGVASMGSGGALVARAIAANLGASDSIAIIAIGEGAQAAALLHGNQVDALSLYDTQYALIENAGVALRQIANPDFDRFPSNGFIVLDDVLAKHRDEAVALGRGYAMGTVFAMANPEAAARINWQVFPYTKATGKDEATALNDDVKTLEARIANWKLDKAGVKNWGESSLVNYQAYLDFLLKWEVLKEPIKASDVVTNDLIGDINAFDPAPIVAQAKAWKP
jgi:NitT/TauT family transport system substrate-binding protein